MTTSFVSKKDGSRNYYYKCTNKSKHGAAKCQSRDIHSNEIECFIELLIKNIAGSDYLFESVFTQLGFNESNDLKKFTSDKSGLNSNLKKIKLEIENLMNFISKNTVIDIESVSNKLKDLELQKLYTE